MQELTDRFGRVVRDLRISVTDRCNFRCTYCMDEEMTWLPRSEVLTFEEITRVARLMVGRFGLESIRLTGGEPTVRADIDALVAELAALSTEAGPIDVAMTTNGASLRLLADRLRRGGGRGGEKHPPPPPPRPVGPAAPPGVTPPGGGGAPPAPAARGL